MSHKNKVIDSDAVFEINPITRTIQNVSTTKKVLVQYDHNSEKFTFSLPRHIEGHDMTECNRVQVHYETNGGYTDCVELSGLKESASDSEKVVCTWLISQNATRDIGALRFLLKFACVNNDTGEYEYIWSTGLFNGISVSEGMNNVAGVDDIPPDFLYSITQQLENKLDKDEYFKLAMLGDAGTNKVLFIGDSDNSDDVNFYSKEQTDAALDNKIDKKDGLYLVKPISKKTSSNHPDGQKEWTGMSLMHTTDYSKRSDVIIPAYTSDLENDSDFVTREQMNEAISDIQGGGSSDYSAYYFVGDVPLGQSGDFDIDDSSATDIEKGTIVDKIILMTEAAGGTEYHLPYVGISGNMNAYYCAMVNSENLVCVRQRYAGPGALMGFYGTVVALNEGGGTVDAYTKTETDKLLKNKVDNFTFDEFVLQKYTANKSHNMLDINTFVRNYYITKSGQLVESEKNSVTDYIAVTEGDVIRTYVINSGMLYDNGCRMVCCYDLDRNVLSTLGTNSPVSNFTVPAGVSYVRVTVVCNGSGYDQNSYMLTLNHEATEYEEYGAVIYKIGSDFLTESTQDAINTIKGQSNNRAVAIPKNKIYQTVGLSEKWYKVNMATPKTDYINISSINNYGIMNNDYYEFLNTTEGNGNNGFKWQLYDDSLNLVYNADNLLPGYAQGAGWGRTIKVENLPNCSILAIGDSTVATSNAMMLSRLSNYFASKEVTLTTIGTRANTSGTINHEGRSGWRAQDYCTVASLNNINNAFWNPETSKFDFSYYMTSTGLSNPDFVMIQLGINDLYSSDDTKIEPTWLYVKEMIDSIISYNSGIKIILNLPTPGNADASKHISTNEFMYRNRIIKYNEYVMNEVLSNYGDNKVRCSYCHLILDPSTDIYDNVHPNESGFEKMALEVVNQINNW